MRAVILPLNLASRVISYDVTGTGKPEICDAVLCARIIRGFDGRKSMGPEHYYVGSDVAGKILDEVFTVRSEEQVSPAQKSLQLSLLNEIKNPEFRALVTHLVHDAMGSEDAALILPDVVSYQYGETSSVYPAGCDCRRVDEKLNPTSSEVVPERISTHGFGSLMLYDHVIQVFDDVPDQAVPDGDICGGEPGTIMSARVVTQGFDPTERTIAVYQLEVLDSGVLVTLSSEPRIVPKDEAVSGDEEINLIGDAFKENGEVITTGGKVLNVLTGLAKCVLLIPEGNEADVEEKGEEDDDTGQATQQSTELD